MCVCVCVSIHRHLCPIAVANGATNSAHVPRPQRLRDLRSHAAVGYRTPVTPPCSVRARHSSQVSVSRQHSPPQSLQKDEQRSPKCLYCPLLTGGSKQKTLSFISHTQREQPGMSWNILEVLPGNPRLCSSHFLFSVADCLQPHCLIISCSTEHGHLLG